MRKKIVYVGLDACDPALAQRFAAAGLMPNLQHLLTTGARAPVSNPHGLFVGSLWVNFGTALRPDKHGFHCWDKIDPQTYEYRLNTPRIEQFPPFWTVISEAGGKVCVIDVPHFHARSTSNALQVFEWGCHDKHFGLTTCPPELATEIAKKHGFHPALRGADAYEVRDTAPDDEVHRASRYRTREEECALLNDLLRGVERKTELALDLHGSSDWDLFLVVFGESHAIGHQQWHLHDPAHPRHDPQTVAAMGGDPIAQVYAALDRAVGKIRDACGSADLFLVHLSHGMGPHYDGTHLLEEILLRLDSPAPRARDSALKRVMRPAVPALQRWARTLGLPAWLRSNVGKAVVNWPANSAEARSKRRFFMEPNNTVYGGVRLNLAGREPSGIVAPEDADRVIAALESDLLELVNADTGRPVIRAVERSSRWHKRSNADAMPDLFLDWERSAPIETVTSPKIGAVHERYDHWRTGDHRPAGLLLLSGEGLPAGERLAGLSVEDIGPSIAARLGVQLNADGRPASWSAA